MNRLLRFTATLALCFTSVAAAQRSPISDALSAMPFRNIGPFRPSAWVTSLAVPAAPVHEHLYTIWVGVRSGGVWKTINGGVTWDPVFDSAGVQSIGAIAVAPSDGNIVWVGTGDNANARSSYSGKGVFKTIDGGKHWSAMGLQDSHHIARIVIDPHNPNIVYVAAIGHLFSTNAERGVFRTTDGGKTWKKVLYVDDHTGAIDLVIDPSNPRRLYAAMYDKQRLPWRLIESGPGSGIFRTTDGGDTWTKLTGGLPTGPLGRIGLDIYRKNPRIVYALIENQNPSPKGRGIIGNEIYRTDDGGASWRRMSDTNVAGGKAPYSFNQIRVDPSDDKRIIVNSDNMTVSEDGGKTWDDRKVWPTGFFRRSFGDFRTMWFDPADPKRIMLGSDGGLQVSVDGGHTSDFFPNLRVGEAYAVGVDMDDPFHVYAGFQDHDSWKGPVNGRWGFSMLEDWVTVGPGDGMYNVVDPTDSRWAYNTRELNQLGRMDQETGMRKDIRPPQPEGVDRLRYNWIAPIALSPYDPKTLYAGAQVLFRSRDRGDTWEVISPDLTTNDSTKIGFPSTPYCTISTLAESPVSQGMIWVGTDDGKVQLTRDAGKTWTDLTSALEAAGAPRDRWVSRVFPSPSDANVAFVSKNGFRNDDFTPYLYRTTDGGKTWTSISNDLPRAPINVVVQDRVNPHLLFVGNDVGVFVSIDDGAHWIRWQADLPTIPVHDIKIHPRESDIVLATYGRALWVGDMMPLRELTPEVLSHPAYLFDIKTAARYEFGTQGMNFALNGDKYLRVPNEPEGIAATYSLLAGDSVRITVADSAGAVVRQLSTRGHEGLNHVVIPFAVSRGRGRGGRGARPGAGGRGGATDATAGATITPGRYTVTLEAAGQRLTKPAIVRERIR
jgi:BNR/Asp-box repeat.